MSCEQVIVVGYEPDSSHKMIGQFQSHSLGDCSNRCCTSEECDIFSYEGSSTSGGGGRKCTLYKFPEQPIYLPFPNTKNMNYTGNMSLNTGILMKRKIMTWIPWIALIILLFMIFFCF